jgi:hypothetical protein
MLFENSSGAALRLFAFLQYPRKQTGEPSPEARALHREGLTDGAGLHLDCNALTGFEKVRNTGVARTRAKARTIRREVMEVLVLEIVATAALLVSHLAIVVWNRFARTSQRG